MDILAEVETTILPFTTPFSTKGPTSLIDQKFQELKELIEQDEYENIVIMRFALATNEDGNEGLGIHFYVDGKKDVIKAGIKSLIKSKHEGALFLYKVFLNYFIKTINKSQK